MKRWDNKTPAIQASAWEAVATWERKVRPEQSRAELSGERESHLPEVADVFGFPQKMVKGSLEHPPPLHPHQLPDTEQVS